VKLVLGVQSNLMQSTRLTCKINSVGSITEAAQKQYKKHNNKETKQKYYSNKKTRNINKVLGQISADSVSKK
jgi:hypothetical protein